MRMCARVRFVVAWVLCAITGTVLAPASPAHAADCGRIDVVEIAEFNWPTASLLAHLHKLILERGYGCNVKLVQSTQGPAVTRLAAQGKPDIVPEVWVRQNNRVWRQAVSNGRAFDVSTVLSEGSSEGWWIPKFVADANPKLKKVSDLAKFRHLFKDPDRPQMARLVSCPAAWECAIINRNLLRAYRLDRYFRAYEPNNGSELEAAIVRAHVSRTPVLVFHWSPAPVLGRYPMVRLAMGRFNARGHACNRRNDCKRPHAGTYPPSRVAGAVGARISRLAPETVRYVRNVSFDTATMNRLLAWQSENKASSRLTAETFLRQDFQIWSRWVPPEVARRIRESLG